MKCRLALKWAIYFYDFPAAVEILMRFAWTNFSCFFVFFFLFTLISHNAGSLMCCDLLLIVGIFPEEVQIGGVEKKETQRWQLVGKESAVGKEMRKVSVNILAKFCRTKPLRK